MTLDTRSAAADVTGAAPADQTRVRRRLRVRATLGGLPWVLPALALVVFAVVYPMFSAVWLSFFDKDPLAVTREWVGLDNYADQLRSAEFWHAAWVGVVYAATSVIAQLALGLATALLLHQTFRGRGVLRALVLLPYLIPTAAVALMFAFMFNDIYGIVNKVLLSLGILDEPILFLGDSTWAMPVVVLLATWKWTPFIVIILLARLQSIDQGLYESAKVEGAGPVRSFFDITLPALRSAIALVVLLRSVWMFNKFDIPYIVTGGGPLDATRNLPIHTYETVFREGQQGAGSALAVLMFLVLLMFAIPYFYFFKPEKEVATE